MPKLDPASVKIIDKSTEDWMVWAGQFSNHINYTTPQNTIAGTMKPFFTRDVAAQLAMAASYEPGKLSQFFREKLNLIEKENTGLKEAYTNIYDIIFSYLLIVDRLFRATKADVEFNTILLNHIRAKLLFLEKRAFSYYKASLDTDPEKQLITAASAPKIKIFNEQVYRHTEVLHLGLSPLGNYRYDRTSNFTSWYAAVEPDTSVFGGISGDAGNKIKYIGQHNFFTGILDEITASATFIVRHSKKYLNKYLSDWPGHQPDYALFLSWLQLLKGTGEHLNELTGRHMDFYYKKVLQLKPLGQSPDTAFLIPRLNKMTKTFAVEEGTVFQGPKDEEGERIFYRNEQETVLNQAEIKILSAVYYSGKEEPIHKGKIFAAPVINSSDGIGGKFMDNGFAWHPFHIKEYEHGTLQKIKMPLADTGFAISSHYLRLKEGKRTIELVITCSGDEIPDSFPFKAFITTEREWLEIQKSNLRKDGSNFNFTLEISADDDPVTGYNREIHSGNLQTKEPVLKILLAEAEAGDPLYSELLDIKITDIALTVKVGEVNNFYNEEGLKDLELHNDLSPLNPAKPFHPWGFEPVPGNSFIIGSDEIFYKPNTKIQLNFAWKNFSLNSTGAPYKEGIYIDYTAANFKSYHSAIISKFTPKTEFLKLSGNKWKTLVDDVDLFFSDFSDTESSVLGYDLSESSELFLQKDQQWKPYGAKSNKGFLKLKMINDFGHRKYHNDLQSYLRNNPTGTDFPVYPYNPTLQSFSISYEAGCELSMETGNKEEYKKKPLSFFHLGPFGDSERHNLLQGTKPGLVSNLIKKSDEYKSQGSLFLGLENLSPGDSLSVLFQLQEGSEDPLLEKPANHLYWEYLTANDTWKEFDSGEVGDNTSQLIKSGIIKFVIPRDASLEHTAFENGLIWIRCRVEEAPDAVSRIIGIHPNAVKVNRIIPEGKEYRSMVIPAGEIKKLNIPKAEIKKIEQPYSSFGGTPGEDPEKFNLRASERLRHKDRAVTIWDYERLVLQEFPEIYKVKCLNHTKTGGSLSEGDLVYNEVAPGHISIITIPGLANRNDVDPLKPYTKKSTLQNIAEFLRKRISCHIQIHTAQPDFEEVKVKCRICLKEGFSDVNYYKEVIQKEITAFLSPWAYNSDADLNFGGRVHRSVLIDFIEELPYVEFLTHFELFQIIAGELPEPVEEAVASTGRSILVSVPAIDHELCVVENAGMDKINSICDEQ